MVTPTAEDVLEMSFISYSTPLDLARRWLQSGDRDERQEAKKLLEGLIGRYPHSLDIGQHLALCYLESEEEERARRILERMSLLSRNPNEEILARGGRVYRDQGDRYVKWQDDDSDRNAELQALRLYRQALQEYEKAYLVRSGHYPGINVATLHLLIAAIEPDEGQQTSHLEESKKVAHELLNDRAKWPSEYPDDPVWHAATQGEARLLLREWQAAGKCYQSAKNHRECRAFHLNSMRKQVDRILAAFNRLAITPQPPFNDLDTLLPQQAPTNSDPPET